MATGIFDRSTGLRFDAVDAEPEARNPRDSAAARGGYPGVGRSALAPRGSRLANMGESAYSYSLTTFSPSGKLVQIEYALSAVTKAP